MLGQTLAHVGPFYADPTRLRPCLLLVSLSGEEKVLENSWRWADFVL